MPVSGLVWQWASLMGRGGERGHPEEGGGAQEEVGGACEEVGGAWEEGGRAQGAAEDHRDENGLKGHVLYTTVFRSVLFAANLLFLVRFPGSLGNCKFSLLLLRK